MSCPHGSGPPSSCSQCLGVVPVRVVPVVDGVWMVGDRVVDRTGALQKQADYGTVETSGGKKRCNYCRKVGHVEEKCRTKFNNEALAASKLGVCDVAAGDDGRVLSAKKAG